MNESQWAKLSIRFLEGVVSSRLYRFGRFELGHGPLEGHLSPVRGHRGAVSSALSLLLSLSQLPGSSPFKSEASYKMTMEGPLKS